MSHGFSRIFTDNPALRGVDFMLMETPPLDLKCYPCEFVAEVLA